MNRRMSRAGLPEVKIGVREPRRSPPKGWVDCELNRNIKFSTTALESYAFSKWEPVIYDAMLVAASVEYADVLCRRTSLGWPRHLSIRVPVDDPARWEAPAVSDGLLNALEFVTGDYWSISFFKREGGLEDPVGDPLDLFPPSKAVLAYSEGMDSLAVAGLAKACLGSDVVRVRVGGKSDAKDANGTPFVSVPYRVTVRAKHREATARSRGFKFAMISGLAAYLTGANKIIVPREWPRCPRAAARECWPCLPRLPQPSSVYASHGVFLGSASRTAHPLRLPPLVVHEGGNPREPCRRRRRRELAIHQVLLARQSVDFCPRIVAPLRGLRCVHVEACQRSRGWPFRTPRDLCLY